ncbi:MAG TPA: helix-turn-helix domain-containing protein [Solirubrobacterales bacterium]
MASKRSKGNGRREPKNLRQVIDPALAQALSHPLRSHILMTLGDGTASPSEVAKELEMNARDLSYHFGILVEIGMIKLVRTEKRRGVLEHFYEQTQSRFRIDLLRDAAQAAMEARQDETFSGLDSHQGRITVVLDEQGRRDVFELMQATIERVLEVGEQCSESLQERPEEGAPVEVFVMGFENTAAASRRTLRRSAGTG